MACVVIITIVENRINNNTFFNTIKWLEIKLEK
ncbi:hypothetical protein Xmir_04162 [Xenorhabdus miraniensis]|uniref:Uncharacterized protein n=1 Tax=Xenorhabdus miraniensis TaxID=351674 RepID=A0A2D0JJT4_9GAMM|nr:hypothetical protein Xmir_04162 [Xenorhabdus miraniensis]